MRSVLLTALVFTASQSFAQQLVKQATINTTTTVTAPEEEDISDVGAGGQGRGGGMFRNFGDGETKSVTMVKDSMVKTTLKTDMMRSTIIRNNTSKMTTTLTEMMGKKMGFYMSDDDQKAMGQRMDSMMKERSKDTVRQRAPREKNVEIDYTSTDTKKIAGYVCKKAYIVSTNFLGQKDSLTVWYTPEFKLENLSSTGGTMGFGNTTTGFDKINGFVMGYTRKMPRDRSMEVEVTKVDLKKDVDQKEFDIPKDFDLKPMSEMQNMFGGRGGGGATIMRMGN